MSQLDSFRELFESEGISDEDIAEMSGVDLDEVRKYRDALEDAATPDEPQTPTDAIPVEDPDVRSVERSELLRRALRDNPGAKVRVNVKFAMKARSARLGGKQKNSMVQRSDYRDRMAYTVIEWAEAGGHLDKLTIVAADGHTLFA